MKPSTTKRLVYSILFLLIFVIELLIALFVRDDVIRPYVGDALIIPLICCLIRIISPVRPRLLGIFAIAAGAIAELLQYFEFDKLLGVEGTVLGVILGSTFDVKDIICYAVGGLLFYCFELFLTGKKKA